MQLTKLIDFSRKHSQLMSFLYISFWIAQFAQSESFLTQNGDTSVNKATSAVPTLCNLNCSSDNETYVFQHCLKSEGRHMWKRCCFNSTEDLAIPDVIGIDLKECNITQESFSSGILGFNTLLYISLEGTNISSLSNTDFHRNTGILYLSLPKTIQCFGNESAWDKVDYSDPEANRCYTELNPCQTENVTCPQNSHCVHAGIDLIECLCDEDYYGYKCMNKGKFPVTQFALGLSISTVFVCIFFWFTQRRYVKNNIKNK